MKILKIISICILFAVGLIVILGDLLDNDGSIGWLLSFLVIKVMGVLMIVLGFTLIRSINDIDDYIDDDMDRLI